MTHIVGRTEPGASDGRAAARLLALPLAGLFALAVLGFGYIVYILWPRWPEPPVAPDTPPLPIIVAGVVFNVPPAAIRTAVQRRAGTQERIDLVYLWPALTPPETTAKTSPAGARPADRIFVTIAGGDGTLPPAERLKVIYPRYTESVASAGPGGLTLVPFRSGTPYQAEDLLFDQAAPDRFLLRCSRAGRGAIPGVCLHEQRIGSADVTVRFPRHWLADWPNVLAGIDRLMAMLRPPGS
jgi:hypothetical protein